MGVKVSIHVEHFADAIPQFREVFFSSSYSNLISVDGHLGSGKSSFAKIICAVLDGGHLEMDDCLLSTRIKASPYVDMIDHQKLSERLAALTVANNLVVISGLCLEWIVPQLVHNSFRVYMHRDGYTTTLGDQRTRSRLGTIRYHKECDPAAAAHFIISSPGL
jgi:ABC-type transport system involved in cytochrome bd biosynthesis fused ATPase/permease subunit